MLIGIAAITLATTVKFNISGNFEGVFYSEQTMWGQQVLQPEDSKIYTLAIGMAGHDPKTGFPVKPYIDLDNFP